MKAGLTAQHLARGYPSPTGLAYAQLEFVLEVILETANSWALNRNKLPKANTGFTWYEY